MSREIVVIGAGGHAKVVVATALAAGFQVRAVLDDNPQRWGKHILGVEVIGPVARARELAGAGVIAIGENRIRKILSAGLGLRWEVLVHPQSIVHPSVRLGEGTQVFAGTVIQPDTLIGAHSIINTSASVDHDCVLGDFVHIAPGVRVAGGVTLGEGVLMGISSCALPGSYIGAWSVVGGGSVVVDNLPPEVTAVGVPARPISTEDRRE